MKKYLSIFFFLFTYTVANSQDAALSESIISIAEEFSSDESYPEDVGAYIEMLFELYENPVNLNSSNEEELSRLFFLSDFQIKVLYDHIKSSGRIVSHYEIAALPGFDRETATMMSIFIRLDEQPVEQDARTRWRNTVVTNVIFRDTEPEASWLGSPTRILTKYKFTAGGFSGGITAEKDPGEKYLSGSPALPDMFSGHIAWNGKGLVKQIIIGDFSTRFGQGIILNTNLTPGVSLHSPGLMASRNQLRPYTSTDENNFFRGFATEFSLKNASLALLYSNNNIDATMDYDMDSGEEYVQSFYTSGLHNTPTAMKKKDVLNEQLYAINAAYNFRNFKVGALWSHETLSAPVKPDINNPEKVFSFSGSVNHTGSIYYNFIMGRILFFGEVAINELSKFSAIQGVTARLSDRLTTNLFFRVNEKGFYAIRGKGTVGSYYPGNTIFGNFTFEAAKHLFISGGCEVTNYDWLRYNISSPSYKIRRELRLKYIPSDNFSVETSYNYSLTTSDSKEINKIPELRELIVRSYNTVFRYNLTNQLTLGTKFYFKSVEEPNQTGMLMAQDVNYHAKKLPLTFWLRFSLYNTGGWDSRIYAYENDLLYSYSIPALYGKGSKHYMMISWKPGNKTELRFRYAISSTHSETGEDIINDFRVQIRISI